MTIEHFFMHIHHRRMTYAIITSVILEFINKISPLIVIHHAQKKLGLVDFGWAQYQLALFELVQPLITYGYINFGMAQAGKFQDLKEPNQDEPIASLFSHIFILKGLHALVLTFALALWMSFESMKSGGLGIPGKDQLISFSLYGMVVAAAILDGFWVQMVKGRLAHLSLMMGMMRLASLILILLLIRTQDDRGLFVFLSFLPNTLVAFYTGLTGLKKMAFRPIDTRELLRILKQSTPFALVVLMLTLWDRVDLMVVQKCLGYETAGVYAGPAKLVQSLSMLVGSLSAPFYAETIRTKDPGLLSRHLAIALWILMTFLSPIVLGASFVERPILDFVFTDLPQSADGVLSLLVWSLLGSILISTFGLQILMSQSLPWSLFGGLSFGMAVMSLLFVLRFSSMDVRYVAVSVALAKLMGGLYCMAKSRRIIDFIPWASMVKPLMAAAMMGVALWMVRPTGFLTIIGIGAAFYFLFLCLISYQEMKALRGHPVILNLFRRKP